MFKNIHELESYILLNWEQEWDDESKYFVYTPTGEYIAYDFVTESFYLNETIFVSHIDAEEKLKVSI